MKAKKSYVLWSGGLDSTYLIQKLLSENPNQIVIAGYVEIMNNEAKTKTELAAVEKMSDVLKVLYPNRFQFRGTVYKCEVKQTSNWMPLLQMPIWISAVMSTTPHDVQDICIGYVMNDCAISYLNELQALMKTYATKLCQPNFPKIKFPLSKINKEEIHNNILGELKQFVVWCEMPNKESDGTFKPCGRCVSCQHSPIYASMPKAVDEKLDPTSMKKFVEVINPEKTTTDSDIVAASKELSKACETLVHSTV